MADLRARLRAGHRHGRARSAAGWSGARRPRAGRLRRVGSGLQAARRPGVRARARRRPGETVKLAAARRRGLAARGYHAQVQAQDDGLALFHLDGGAARRSASRTAASSSATTRYRARPRSCRKPREPGGVQPERAAAADRAGHALPDRSVTSPARASWPISASCAASTSTSACRCRSCIRARRRRSLDSAGAALPHEVQAAARSAAAAGRGGAERAAEGADSAGRRRVVRRARRTRSTRRWRASSRRCRRSIRRSKAPRDRRSAGCSTICRRCTAR